jgi:hypothetical protein
MSARRRTIDLTPLQREGEGITFKVTRKGVDVSGYYDHFVALEGYTVTWEAIDEARKELQGVQK